MLLGTRASKLALKQGQEAVDSLSQVSSANFEIVTVSTAGDQNRNRPANEIGVGIFVKELEQSLQNRDVNIAVHSLKDLPSLMGNEFTLAVLTRIDPRDAMVCKREGDTLETLPQGAYVGTGSLRRKAQILRKRPDLNVVPVRGNVPTRISMLDGPDGLNAVVLASAGLIRLGLENRISQKLPVDDCIPAVGQGSVALQTLRSDVEASALCRLVEDSDAMVCAKSERTFLSLMDAGCTSPTSAYASILDKGGESESIRIVGFASTADGSQMLNSERVGPISNAEELGRDLAHELIDNGGKSMMLLNND